MKTGKLPNDVLEKIVLGKIRNIRSEVLVRPGVGMDCSAVDFGEYTCVLSSDPITGTAKEIGRLAVHISCNDIASCGVEPLGLMTTILCPPGSTEKELEQIMEQLADAAASINVDLLGGHTEVTTAVTRFVISCTAVGRCVRGSMVAAAGAMDGDELIITKHAGLEGASIIAHEKGNELKAVLGEKTIEEAKAFMNDISVVKDGLAAARYGAHAMHDVTEGGILGAVWEICEASGMGAEVYIDRVPVLLSTRRICEYYSIDPYRLISSGCMLIAAPDGKEMTERLKAEGIAATVIGRLCGTGERLMLNDGKKERIAPPEADELYKVL
ncbi:MAG TPA: AIR synthase family protein [Clostridia bacterium]|nr:AIR synthase family protein [Clostridia bacterium]